MDDIEDSNSKPISLTIQHQVKEGNSTGGIRSILEKRILMAFKAIQPEETILQLIASSKILLNSLNNQLTQPQLELNQSDTITLNIIEKLRRIASRNIIKVDIQIGKIYEVLLRESYHPILLSKEIKILIELSNEVISLLSKIEGTKVFHLLRMECNLFLQSLLKDIRLNDEQMESMKEEVKMFSYFNLKTNEGEVINMTNLSNEYSIQTNSRYYHCLETLSSMKYNEEGYQYLSQYGYGYEVFKSILNNTTITDQTALNYQLFIDIGRILNSYLKSPQYRLTFDLSQSQCQNKNMHLLHQSLNSFTSIDKLPNERLNQIMEPYVDKEYEIDIHHSHIEGLFDLCFIYLNSIVTVLTKNELTDIFFTLIKKLYFTCHSKTPNALSALIIHFYSITSSSSLSKQHKQFLRYVIHSSSTIENNILNNKLLKLYPQYRYPEIVSCNESIQSEYVNLTNLNQFHIGYNCTCMIEPCNQWSLLIEIDKPMSIMYLSLMIEYYDITIVIYKYNASIRDKKNLALVDKLDRVKNIDDDSFQLVYLVNNPGIYKIVFDNSYSWFKSKSILYKLKIFKPIENNNDCNWMHNIENYHYIANQGKLTVPLIQMKDYINENQMNASVIPILYDIDNRTIVLYTEKANNQMEVILPIKENEKINNDIIISNTIKKYYSYYNDPSIFKEKIIIINCFIMESSININMTIDSKHLANLNLVINDDSQYRNISLHYINLPNSCIEYTLYQKSIYYEKNSNILHIHINSKSFYAGLYLTNHNQYNTTSLKQYSNDINSLLSFIEKIKSIFNSFEINLTYTQTHFESVNSLKQSIETHYPDIEDVYIYNYDYFTDLLHQAHLFLY